MSNLFHIPLAPLYKWIHICNSYYRVVKTRRSREKLMPLKLSTTNGKIQNLLNSKCRDYQGIQYMRSNVSLKHHQNINLKVIITFSNFKILLLWY